MIASDARAHARLAGISGQSAPQAWREATVTRRLIAHFSRASRLPPERRRDLEQLTEREREVLALLARGLSNTELAETLHVSLPTVKTHVSRILTKLGARDRTQLVVFAYEAGLAPAP